MNSITSGINIIFLLITAFFFPCRSLGESLSPSSTDHDNDSSHSGSQEAQVTPGQGHIVQSLFRFPASHLGPEFDDILQNWHNEVLRANETSSSKTPSASVSDHYYLPPISPEASGKAHAFYSVSTPAATIFRRQCYGPAPQSSTLQNNLYNNLEQRRKAISFEYMKDAKEELRLMHATVKRFYPAFVPEERSKAEKSSSGSGNNDHSGRRMHKKKSKSMVNTIHAQSTLPPDYDSPSKLAFQTGSNSNSPKTQQWSWYPPAHFSSRGTPDNMPFRINTWNSMRNQLQQRLQEQLPDFAGFEHGRQSGMFWYPPGGVREWHNNQLDLVGNIKKKGGNQQKDQNEEIFASQVWRMYFVRTARDSEFDERLAKLKKKRDKSYIDQNVNDHSAMHIIPGEDTGITLDVLQKAGARPLSKEEEKRQWSDEFAEDYDAISHKPNANDREAEAEAGGNTVLLDRKSVWRLPDQDGYVTLFRLPEIWHCIVSEEVHRYSLGFAFSDREVQALLRLAGVEFDVQSGKISKGGDSDSVGDNDEL